MKLVYLWVEEFRCFHEQGFNFTNEYDVQLKKNKESGQYELTFEDKTGYIPSVDFWGKEKKNISALRVFVGENGRGKTALLKLATLVLNATDKNNEIADLSIKFFLLVEEKENVFRYKHNIEFDERKINETTGKKFCSIKEKIHNDVFLNISEGHPDIEMQIKFVCDHNTETLNDFLGFPVPKKLQIVPNETDLLIQDIENEIKGIKNGVSVYAKTDKMQRINSIAEQLGNLSRNFKESVYRIPQIEGVQASLFLSLWFVMIYFMIKEIDWSNYSSTDIKEQHKIENILQSSFDPTTEPLTYDQLWENLKKNITNIIQSNENYREWRERETYDNLSKLMNIINNVSVENDKYLFLNLFEDGSNSEKERKIIEWSKGVYGIKDRIKDRPSLKDFINFKWGLSSGEYAIMNTFAHIYSYQKKWEDEFENENKMSPIIFLDEIDLSLHPRWQQWYLKRLLDYCNRNDFFPKDKENSTVQLILCTHSPIILSDVPNEFITYLMPQNHNGTLHQDENTMYTFVAEKETKRTFGANIYDIYNDVFYMDKTGMGVRGAWVSDWINKIIKEIKTQEENFKEYKESIDQEKKNEDITPYRILKKLDNIEVRLNYLDDEILLSYLLKKVKHLKYEINSFCIDLSQIQRLMDLSKDNLETLVNEINKVIEQKNKNSDEDEKNK